MFFLLSGDTANCNCFSYLGQRLVCLKGTQQANSDIIAVLCILASSWILLVEDGSLLMSSIIYKVMGYICKFKLFPPQGTVSTGSPFFTYVLALPLSFFSSSSSSFLASSLNFTASFSAFVAFRSVEIDRLVRGKWTLPSQFIFLNQTQTSNVP